ncbi:uncharacterized protein MELLADRAFT_58549 [Melampsora larici-populina 98AG31]|uniref:Uncharacterized protein n=1 Tax=Melampsora larici-populina (strain 98AG31 / pathotype 3-4-7) TaxID=747676 RepID=F4R3X6_MELLP|nr:uncharacterized protein MELLADRAFT_58549 [Melampsora larici-populina 98AG31]EGG12698.1 hypothetical protein MELLADRAFT_58549 [Melampsora larici-populina 98AG31]
MDEDSSSSSSSLLKRDEQSNHLKRQLLGIPDVPDIKAELTANKAPGSPPTGAGPSPSPPTGTGPSTGTAPSSPLPATPSPTPVPNTSSNTPIPPGPTSQPAPAATPAPNGLTPTSPNNTNSPLAPFGPAINGNGTTTPTISPNSSTPIPGGNTTSPTASQNTTHPTNTTTSELPTSTGNTTAPFYKPPPKRNKDNGIATTTVKTMVLVFISFGLSSESGNSNRVGNLNKDWKIMMKTYSILVLLCLFLILKAFGEKRYDSHLRPSSITSASSPSSANRRGNGQFLGDGNYPGPNTSVSGYSQPGPRVGEFYSHPYETHNVDDPTSLSLVYPPKRGYTLEMDSPDTAYAGPKDKEPTKPRPVFESNIHRLSDLSLGAKFGA